MDFIEKIQEISHRIPKQLDHINTEEATKSALVMPFIQALGYNVFDPTEVVPELVADVGTKKGEKVDYAIKKDGRVVILIECKWCQSNLDECHASQLYRYFSVTEARFGVLTNGIYYKFFSDLEEQNKMDEKPFLEFNLLSLDDARVEELKKFTKTSFDLDNILETANELKYTNAIKKIFTEQVSNPSPDFVKFFASQVYSKRMTQQALTNFHSIVKRAFNQFIKDRVNDRLKSALEDVQEDPTELENQSIDESENGQHKNAVVTTDEEVEAFNIVKAILRETVDVSRIALKDRKSYCNILLDNNVRKPICRLYFDRPKKLIGIMTETEVDKYEIESLDEIFYFSNQIIQAVKLYM